MAALGILALARSRWVKGGVGVGVFLVVVVGFPNADRQMSTAEWMLSAHEEELAAVTAEMKTWHAAREEESPDWQVAEALLAARSDPDSAPPWAVSLAGFLREHGLYTSPNVDDGYLTFWHQISRDTGWGIACRLDDGASSQAQDLSGMRVVGWREVGGGWSVFGTT